MLLNNSEIHFIYWYLIFYEAQCIGYLLRQSAGSSKWERCKQLTKYDVASGRSQLFSTLSTNTSLFSLQQGATVNTVVGALAVDDSSSLRANKSNYHWPRSNVPVEHSMWIVSPARPVSSGGMCLRCKFDVFSTTSA